MTTGGPPLSSYLFQPFDRCVRSILWLVVLLGMFILLGDPTMGADYSDALQKYHSGKYEEALAIAAEEVDVWNERWPRLLIQCQLATGRYKDANAAYDAAMKRYPTSLTLRLMGLDALRQANRPVDAEAAKAQILLLLRSSSSRFASRDNLIAAGRYYANGGADAKEVLNLYYDRVRDADPTYIEAYIATAELALSKGDYKVAADTLQDAQRVGSDDPRIDYLLSKAWEPSDSQKASEALEAALTKNPSHIPSLLFQAEQLIDREFYELAERTIDKILGVNPHEQEAWALLAVLAHLRGDYELERLMRATALSTWGNNPRVDHLIGLKLSQKYRFAEGAEYQRKSLSLDASYVPATFQLAQDLLRLGEDTVGWGLAEMVAEEDPYNVVAHNLVTLKDRIERFTLLEDSGIMVRMEGKEADIYGSDVLKLLKEAKQVLCEKYDVHPNRPIIVEIFPQQKDFAIRTFGLPGGAGYLGVCFGRVITANSPASQGERPSNWKSVLWHEFCHVVTLEKTKNRMPRWLSEGISVYEERQRNASWGESMTPQYREMLLDSGLTPVSKLSGAFLSPPSPIHLQFAYYQSSLVIEFIVDKYGVDALNQVLVDLGNGIAINDALTKNVDSIAKLDAEFMTFAQEHAKQFGAKASWSREGLPERPTIPLLEQYVADHPTNYWGLRMLAESLIVERRFAEAKKHLQSLHDLETTTGAQGGPLEMLAQVLQQLEETNEEYAIRETIVDRSSDALPSLKRLLEKAQSEEKWDVAASYAKRILAINPLIEVGHASLAEASDQLGVNEDVVRALSSMAAMDPIDPAAIDYRLAKAFHRLNNREKSREHVLRALERAPRYRDALRLLLEVTQGKEDAVGKETDTEPDAEPGESLPGESEAIENESRTNEEVAP